MSAPSVGPINVTNNTGWTGVDDVPDYFSARIALTTDNRFVITWSDEREQPDGDEENIGFASYDLTGAKVSYRQKVSGLVSVPDGTRFSNPNIVGIPEELYTCLLHVYSPHSLKRNGGIYSADGLHQITAV